METIINIVIFTALSYFGISKSLDKKYYPLTQERKRFLSFIRPPRCVAKLAKEMSRLKQLGTTVGAYFAENPDRTYPLNPQEFDFDIALFHTSYLEGTNRGIPENWQIPNTWAEFNQSNCPYLFTRKAHEKFTGSATKVLFIFKHGYSFYDYQLAVVYEDGHIARINKTQAIAIWKKAGVWNGN